MFDDFILRYRFWLLGFLILVFVGGIVIIWQDKFKGEKTNRGNAEIAALREQNDLLRQQLSSSTQQVAGATIEENTNQSDKINLNTASVEELDTLPGIGPVRAADIIAYREQNGGFGTIEEIKEIKGIGDVSFEKLKDLITVGE